MNEIIRPESEQAALVQAYGEMLGPVYEGIEVEFTDSLSTAQQEIDIQESNVDFIKGAVALFPHGVSPKGDQIFASESIITHSPYEAKMVQNNTVWVPGYYALGSGVAHYLVGQREVDSKWSEVLLAPTVFDKGFTRGVRYSNDISRVERLKIATVSTGQLTDVQAAASLNYSTAQVAALRSRNKGALTVTAYDEGSVGLKYRLVRPHRPGAAEKNIVSYKDVLTIGHSISTESMMSFETVEHIGRLASAFSKSAEVLALIQPSAE
jgi:hypothetical protein